MEKVSIAEKLALIDRHWVPRIAGELNGQYVKLAKLKGEFLWHVHEAEDELFLVVQGRLTILLQGENVTLEAGEFLIVPRGAEHKPVADEEAHVLLFEPKTTVNTGSIRDERTITEPQTV